MKLENQTSKRPERDLLTGTGTGPERADVPVNRNEPEPEFLEENVRKFFIPERQLLML